MSMYNIVPWKPNEDKLLRDMIGTHTHTDIAAQLGRSAASVSRRAIRLGMKRTAENRKFPSRAGIKRELAYPTMLGADAEPIASSDQERWWSKAREANDRFLELLREERGEQ